MTEHPDQIETSSTDRPARLTGSMLLLGGLSLSIGWGIRGNFGHEYGAMMPGALAAIAVVLVSGRQDWWRRIAYFAFFGALGWSFGGMMSYGQVIAYTHCGHLPSVVYGFASLFVIGFVWGAIGGAGTAAPACMDRDRLTELLGPIIAVFVAWTLQDVGMLLSMTDDGAFRHEEALYWKDTDWIAALLAIPAVLIYAGIRRRVCLGTSLVLHASIGWWVAFLVLVEVLGLRMTPPRSDNWAGALGMTAGIFVFCHRHGLTSILLAGLVSGFIGGFGFAMAQAIKLLGLKTGLATNWHSVLEQTYGFINGIGIAVAMGILASRTGRVTDEPPVRRWTEPFCVGFVVLAVTYVNLVKNVETWIKFEAMPETMYGLHSYWWFSIGYLLALVAFVILAAVHRRRALPVIPTSWLGGGQMLYLVFLWVVVIGNLMRAIPPFHQQRLITEGVIIVNALIVTVLILVLAGRTRSAPQVATARYRGWIIGTLVVGLIGTVGSVYAQTAIARRCYGDKRAPSSGDHVRFGPNATATKAKPKAGQPHP